MEFQFDPEKARSNLEKHGVSFAEGEGVFYDPLALHIPDPENNDEDRLISIGMSNEGKILVVVYTIRGKEIRLISARNATSREVRDYEG